MRNIHPLTLCVALLAVAFACGCRQDRLNTDPSCALRFSADTLRFDTLFAETGSATRVLKVYNDYSNRLEISSVTLRGSGFRANVDGMAADSCGPVYLNARDSMYVYVQTWVENTESTEVSRVTGALVFRLNGNEQSVTLESWGRSARRQGPQLLTSDTEWTGDLPYLVLDTVSVAEGATLTIGEGVTVYFASRGGLRVYGSLVCEGTPERPVTLRGDRDDNMNTTPPLPYDLAPGQWKGVTLRSAAESRLAWTDLRNSSTGVTFDTVPGGGGTLTLDHCRLGNTTGSALTQRGGTLRLLNCLLYNAGGNALNVERGSCEMTHCTVADYYSFSWSARSGSAARLANYTLSENGSAEPSDVYFRARNSIICGSWLTELAVDQLNAGGALDYGFSHCFINKRFSSAVPSNYVSCAFNGLPCFEFQTWADGDRPFVYDFHLTEGSAAIGQASRSVAESCPIDLDGYDRMSSTSGSYDMGCYAYR